MYFLFCVVLCTVCFVTFSVLFVCVCVLYYCHRVATQLQLNISYHKVENEMGGACSAYGGVEMCVQGFGGET